MIVAGTEEGEKSTLVGTAATNIIKPITLDRESVCRYIVVGTRSVLLVPVIHCTLTSSILFTKCQHC